MKDKPLIVLIIMLNFAFSQMSTSDTTQMNDAEKTKIIEIPWPLIFGFPVFGFGVIQNNGKNELHFGAFYYDEEDEHYNEFGGWLGYRIYKNGKGKGLFYGVGIGVFYSNWDYEGQSEPVNSILLLPNASIGKRWIWENGLTFAPFIGPAWEIGKVEANDGTIKTWEDGSKSDGGFEPNIGFSLGYMF